jgi:hypothetical protein
VDAERAQDPAPVGQLLGAGDASQRSHVGADVAAADLGPPLDEHDAKRAVPHPAVVDHAPVAWLEHVEW